MSDNKFEDLILEVSSSSKINRDSLLKLIQEKKAKVGAGYLTDQGALFLVASELGVSVEYDHQRPSSLSRLEADQKSVTVRGRLLSIGVPKSFTRKGGSGVGLLSKVVIYDSSGAVTVSVWDSATTKIIDPALGLIPGDVIQISEAYTRAGLDGRPELNAGEKTRFEKLTENNEVGKKIESLESRVVSPSNVPEAGKFLVIRGRVSGEVKKSPFSRSDGSNSTLISFSMVDELGTGSPVRTVVWNNPNPVFEKLRNDDVATMLNVRTKISTFQNTPSLEIHGDETTCIREFFDDTRSWLLERSKEFSTTRSGVSKIEEKTTAQTKPLPFIGRVISKRYSQSDRKYHLLILDSQKRKLSVTASDDAVKNLGEEVAEDSVVICKPDSLDQGSFRATCTLANSISKVSSRRPDIQLASSLFVKVEELPSEVGAIASLELICLNNQVSREVQTKDGLVKRSELTVADHTGEVKVFAWRNLSKMLDDFSAGDRIVLRAVETQIFEGKKFLVLKNYSSVEKKPISS